MKNYNLIFSPGILLSLLAACTNAPDAEKAKTTEAKEVSAATGETWKVDTTESKIEWVATKVSGYHTGTVNIKSGELNIQDGKPTGGNFVLDMTSMIVSGPPGNDEESNNKLLAHLKSPDFFEVSAHPIATFVITSISPFSGTIKDTTDPRQESISKYKVADPTHTVSGNLTIRGITKNIEFPASIVVSNNSANAIAKFNVDRRQWNIVYPGKPDDLIRDDIHLGISLKAGK
ncbi:MAG TPA: YceI family protein [Chitinophagaceae bacterium]|nr:YceI family protein [Chitinophagaceae bacterium]